MRELSLSAVMAHIAVRRGPQWLLADARVLEPYLPRDWRTMRLWRLLDYIDAHDIGPLH